MCLLNTNLNGFDDKATRWLYVIKYRICIHDHDYVMDFYLMVMLCSTTGPYGQPVIEVVYGEMIFSLQKDCMGDDSSGSSWGVSMMHRPCLTYPGQHQCGLRIYIYFLIFNISKSMYMYNVFKVYI